MAFEGEGFEVDRRGGRQYIPERPPLSLGHAGGLQSLENEPICGNPLSADT